MNDSLILYHEQDHIAWVTLNHPKSYNALSAAMIDALQARIDRLNDHSDIAVLIIQGAGKGFCAGHDLKELADIEHITDRRALFEKCSNLMLAIQALPMPVIAGVHGVASAAGCQLVASCDLAFAANDARFGTPGVNIGLFCSTPMVALGRAIGRKHAMKMLLEGELINAADAVSYGLINEAVAPDQLEHKLRESAMKIVSKSRATIKIGKQSFYRQLDMDVALAYDYCSEIMALNLGAPDAKAGIDAFLTKTAPKWSHKS